MTVITPEECARGRRLHACDVGGLCCARAEPVSTQGRGRGKPAATGESEDYDLRFNDFPKVGFNCASFVPASFVRAGFRRPWAKIAAAGFQVGAQARGVRR
jgi:hypothetical protein